LPVVVARLVRVTRFKQVSRAPGRRSGHPGTRRKKRRRNITGRCGLNSGPPRRQASARPRQCRRGTLRDDAGGACRSRRRPTPSGRRAGLRASSH